MAKKKYKRKKKVTNQVLTDKELVAHKNNHEMYFMERAISNTTKHKHKQNRKGFKKGT